VVALRRKIAFVAADVVCINIAVLLAFLGVYGINIPQEILRVLPQICIAFTLISIPIYYVFQLYSSLWKYASINELIMIISSSIIASLAAYI